MMTALTFQKPQIYSSADLAERGGGVAAWKVIRLLFSLALETHADVRIRHIHTHVIISKPLEADHTLKLTYVPFNQCIDVI